ncbi:hypothetical protein ACFLZK_02180 [Patescibacteria group bacterium]
MLKTWTNSFIENPKNTFFEGEDSDEKILYIFRKANITNLGWGLISIFLLLAPAVFNSFFIHITINYPDILKPSLIIIINIFWYLFTFGYIFERFINWFFNIHIITDKRIVDMDFDHLLHRNITDAPLRNVEDITYTVSGAAQTTFNYGHVTIQTAAEQRELEFHYVSNPAKIQDIISDLVANYRKKHGN